PHSITSTARKHLSFRMFSGENEPQVDARISRCVGSSERANITDATPEEGTMHKVAILAAAIVLSLVLTPPSTTSLAQQGSLQDNVVGTWKIVSWESLRPNGQILNIWMGLHPTGLIIYRPNGYMAVQIMADPRPTFTQNAATSPPPYDEFRNAFFGYY